MSKVQNLDEQFFNHAPLSIIQLDKNFKFVKGNKLFSSITELKQEQLCGSHLRDIMGCSEEEFKFDADSCPQLISGSNGSFFVGETKDKNSFIAIQFLNTDHEKYIKQINSSICQSLSYLQLVEESAGWEEVLTYICSYFGFPLSYIWERRIETGALHHVSTCYIFKKDSSLEFEKLHFRKGEGLPGHAWKESGVVITERLSELKDSRDELLNKFSKVVIAVPVYSGEEIVNIIEFHSMFEISITDELIEAFTTLSSGLSQYIEKKNNVIRVIEQKVEWFAINELVQKISKITTVKEFFGTLINQGRLSFGSYYSACWIKDNDNQLILSYQDCCQEINLKELSSDSYNSTLVNASNTNEDVCFANYYETCNSIFLTGVAFPIYSGKKITAIVEFFGDNFTSPERLNAFRNLVVTLSALYERVAYDERSRYLISENQFIQDLSIKLNSSPSIKDLGKDLITGLCEKYGFSYGSHWDVVYGTDELAQLSHYGKKNYITELTRKWSGFLGNKNCKLSLQHSNEWSSDYYQFKEEGFKVSLLIPIIENNVNRGVVILFGKENIILPEDRIKSLSILIQIISSNVWRLCANESEQNTEALNLIVNNLAEAKTFDEVINLVLEKVRVCFNWEYSSFWRVDKDSQTLKYSLESGSVNEEFVKITRTSSFPKGTGLNGRAWSNDNLQFVQRIGEVKDCCRAPTAEAAGVNSGVAFPLKFNNEIIGTFDFFTSKIISLTDSRSSTFLNIAKLTSKKLEELEASNQEKIYNESQKHRAELILSGIEKATHGDLTIRMPVDGNDTLGSISAGILDLLTAFRSELQQISLNSQSLAAAAEEISAVNNEIYSNAEHAASQTNEAAVGATTVNDNMSAMSAGTEEMIASIAEIARSASESHRVANSAVLSAEQAKLVVEQLDQSSSQIKEVIKVISSIASQTNLLALNATIEAARAGEAGKGFAVVANEVKELAKETSNATGDIAKKIEAISASSGEVIKVIASISEVIHRINDISLSIAGAVEEQSATTKEIGLSTNVTVSQLNIIQDSLVSLSSVSDKTRSGVEENQRACAELAQMAVLLDQSTRKFTF
jgi:methyl-accepting chemotaxis protein